MKICKYQNSILFLVMLKSANRRNSFTIMFGVLQDHWTLQSQRQILHAATVMSLSQKRIDVSETKEAMRMLLLPGYTGAGRSIGDFAPLQLLLWLLDAKVSPCLSAEDCTDLNFLVKCRREWRSLMI